MAVEVSLPAGDGQVSHRPTGRRSSVGRVGRRNRYAPGVAQTTNTPETNASAPGRNTTSPAAGGVAPPTVNKPTQGQFAPPPSSRRSPGVGSTCAYSPTNDPPVASPPLPGGQGGDNIRLTMDAGLENLNAFLDTLVGSPSSPQRSFEFLTAVILNYLSLIETCSRNSSPMKAKLGGIIHKLAAIQHSGNLQAPLQCCVMNGPGYGSCPAPVANSPSAMPNHGPPHHQQSEAALREMCQPCNDTNQVASINLPQHVSHPQSPYWVHPYAQPLMQAGHPLTQVHPRQQAMSHTNTVQAVNPTMAGPPSQQIPIPNSAPPPYCHGVPTSNSGGTDSQSGQPAPMGNQHFCNQVPHPHLPYVQAPMSQPGHPLRSHFPSAPTCYTDPWRAAGYPPVAFNFAGANPAGPHPAGGGFYSASDFYFCQPAAAGIYAVPGAGVLSSGIPISYAQPHSNHHRAHLQNGGVAANDGQLPVSGTIDGYSQPPTSRTPSNATE